MAPVVVREPAYAIAASPGAGSGTPSSSRKMTTKRPPDWCSKMNTRITCVSGLNQDGSCSHPGRKLARWAACNSILEFGPTPKALRRLYVRAGACPRRLLRNQRLCRSPLELGSKHPLEMLCVRHGCHLDSHLPPGQRGH